MSSFSGDFSSLFPYSYSDLCLPVSLAGGEIKHLGSRDEDGEAFGEAEEAMMAILLDHLLHTAVAPMIAVFHLEGGLLRKAGHRAFGLVHLVARQLDIRWDDVLGMEALLSSEHRHRVGTVVSAMVKVAHGLDHHPHSLQRRRALALGRPAAGN